MSLEVWIGWFDSWGLESHYVRDSNEVASLVEELLNMAVSFNL